jgi:gas vesicle protein
MRETDEGAGKAFYFILGGVVGAVAAILLAPSSGRETRQRIRDFADDVKTRAGEYAENVKGTVSCQLQRGKEMLSDKKSMIKNAVDAGREAYVREKERLEKADGE